MPTPDRPTTDASGRRLPRLLTAAVLSGTMLGPAPAMASPTQDAEVADCILIDEVNTRGGSSSQDLPRYVELTNSCDTAVDLSDWSIQGYQSSGTPYSGGNTQLSGSVPAEGSYLILGPAAAGGPVTELHADHDAGAALNMAGGGASVALFSTAEPPEGVSGDLTATENVTHFARLVGVTAPREAAVAAIERVDLVDHADALTGALSGGQRSRVSLAAALVGDPELLVLDATDLGLDPVLRRDLWDLFRRLAADGVTLLVSSHVMDEASRCDRLVLLRDGEVLADDTLPGLLRETGAADAEGAFLALVDRE